MIDKYYLVVNTDTLKKPIYIDMYNCEAPKAPFGLNFKAELIK